MADEELERKKKIFAKSVARNVSGLFGNGSKLLGHDIYYGLILRELHRQLQIEAPELQPYAYELGRIALAYVQDWEGPLAAE